MMKSTIRLLLLFGAAAALPAAQFPLRVAPDRTHLVDSSGKPFLIHGDSPWGILWNLTREEAEFYLDDRQKKGFNAVLVDVVPYSEWSDHRKETNRYGQNPFLTPGDFSRPNDRYFEHLDWFLSACEKRGMLAVLVAADLGHAGLRLPHANGGMWWVEYKENGPEKCRQYGQYLGRRYAARASILWVLGGDRDPGDVLDEVLAMAAGLEETAPDHLKTYHAQAKSSTLFFHTAAWLDINASYGYGEVWEFVVRDVGLAPRKPTFLFESGYELESNDGRGGAPQRMRRQAWGALLAGACGHLYGSVDWKMTPGWRERMDLPGLRQMGVVKRFFESVPWWRLRPSFAELVLAGKGSEEAFAPAAMTDDGRLAVVYMPAARRIAVNSGVLAKGRVAAEWLDPVSGRRQDAGAAATGGVMWFAPPVQNDGAESDWVLVLRVE